MRLNRVYAWRVTWTEQDEAGIRPRAKWFRSKTHAESFTMQIGTNGAENVDIKMVDEVQEVDCELEERP